MIRPRWIAIVLVVASTIAGGAARAEPSSESGSESKALAETLFFTGRGFMEAGRYAEACTKFGESYRLDPTAGTLLNLAVCHDHEGEIASAWGEFRTAAADARRSNRPDREQLAQST